VCVCVCVCVCGSLKPILSMLDSEWKPGFEAICVMDLLLPHFNSRFRIVFCPPPPSPLTCAKKEDLLFRAVFLATWVGVVLQSESLNQIAELVIVHGLNTINA